MSGDSGFDPLEGILVSSPPRRPHLGALARRRPHVLGLGARPWKRFRGPASIVKVEPSPDEAYWRGDGVFLGWTTERLVAAWDALRAAEPEPEASPDFPQLG